MQCITGVSISWISKPQYPKHHHHYRHLHTPSFYQSPLSPLQSPLSTHDHPIHSALLTTHLWSHGWLSNVHEYTSSSGETANSCWWSYEGRNMSCRSIRSDFFSCCFSSSFSDLVVRTPSSLSLYTGTKSGVEWMREWMWIFVCLFVCFTSLFYHQWYVGNMIQIINYSCKNYEKYT